MTMITLKINVGVVYNDTDNQGTHFETEETYIDGNDFKDFDEVKVYLEKYYNVYLVELRRNNLAVAFVY